MPTYRFAFGQPGNGLLSLDVTVRGRTREEARFEALWELARLEKALADWCHEGQPLVGVVSRTPEMVSGTVVVKMDPLLLEAS